MKFETSEPRLEVFLRNNIPQTLSEICSLSIRQIFDLKKESVSVLTKQENPNFKTLNTTILVSFDFEFFFADYHQNSPGC